MNLFSEINTDNSVSFTIPTLKDKMEGSKSQEELQRQIFLQLKKSVRVMFPVKVHSVDADGQRVDLQILAKDADFEGNIIDYSLLVNVPIRYTNQTSEAYIICPVCQGDTGTVEFFDSSIEKLKHTGIVDYHYDEAYHTLSDGLYTSGFKPDKPTIAIPIDASIVMGTNNGCFTFKVNKAGELTVKAPRMTIESNVTITGNVGISSGFTGITTPFSIATFSGGICTGAS